MDKIGLKSGIYLAGVTIAFGMVSGLLGISFSPLYSIGGIGLGIALAATDFIPESPFVEIAQNTKLVNVDGKMPTCFRTVKTEYGYDYYFTLPAGITLSFFENRKEVFEQYMDIKARFSYKDKYILLQSYTSKISEFYPFEAIKADPMTLVIGNSYTGFKTIPLKSHVLICGASGFGKSTMERGIIVSLIHNNKPEDMVLTLTDFKRNELGLFKNSKYVKRFCKEKEEFKYLLNDLEKKAKQRYEIFDEKNVLDIYKYNAQYEPKMAFIVNFIDEVAQLEGDKETMSLLQKRISYDRAAGILYVICTQRPSVDLIPGSVKANIDTRICFKTSDSTNSWIVLDDKEAAQYLSVPGRGLLKYGGDMTEFQAMYLSEDEAISLVKHTFIEKPKKEGKHDNGQRQTNNSSRKRKGA
jgi:S-DNA-T family DNA segregation ATPase FtsK/SpoIIIE